MRRRRGILPPQINRRTTDWMPVDRDLQRCGVQGDQGVAGGLVHMTIEIGIWETLGAGRVGAGEGGRREEVCKSDDAMV